MHYPEDFKEKVRKVYPDKFDLHRRLDQDDFSAGAYLSGLRPKRITLDTILAATSLEELQEKARVEKERYELWEEWRRLFDESF